MHLSWVIGIVFSVLSSIFGSLGKILLKLAHNEQENVRYTTNVTLISERKKQWSQTYFRLGLLFVLILNPLLGAAAYMYASQSILSPMAGLSIIWNSTFGPLLLTKERLTQREIVGAFLIFIGCVSAGLSGNHKTHEQSIPQLMSNFQSPLFLTYIAALCIAAILLLHCRWQERALVFHSTNNFEKNGNELHLENKLFDANGKDSQIENQSARGLSRNLNTGGTYLAIAAGITNGQLYFISVAMQLISMKKSYHPFYQIPFFYWCTLGAFLVAIGGVYLLNVALRIEKRSAVGIIYIYEATLLLAGASSGLCFFQDMFTMSTWHIIVYGTSLGLVIVGIYIIASRLNYESKPVVSEDESQLESLLLKHHYEPTSTTTSI